MSAGIEPPLLDKPVNLSPCLVLIGMAGAGKSTLGRYLADHLHWAHLDTDRYMESWWGMGLQNLRDKLGLEIFLQAEEQAVLQLRLHRTVLSTGGSVIYSHAAMRHLKAMGLIVHVHATLDTIRSRIGAAPQRGLVMPEGMTLDELYAERQKLYACYEDFRVTTDMLSIAETSRRILRFWETCT